MLIEQRELCRAVRQMAYLGEAMRQVTIAAQQAGAAINKMFDAAPTPAEPIVVDSSAWTGRVG